MARSNALRFGVPSDRPLYRRVVDRRRREIAGMPPGARIDSEPQLTKRFGVSRFTVARAIEILVDEGLVNRRQGRGSFVAAPTLKRAPAYLQPSRPTGPFSTSWTPSTTHAATPMRPRYGAIGARPHLAPLR